MRRAQRAPAGRCCARAPPCCVPAALRLNRGLFISIAAISLLSMGLNFQSPSQYYTKGMTNYTHVNFSSVEDALIDPKNSSSLPAIAYSFNGYHGDYLSIPVALAAVFHPRNIYCVLVDASISETEVQTLQRLTVQAVLRQHPDLSPCAKAGCIESRIFVRASDFSVTWGGISEPLSTMDALAKLLELDDKWEFFVNLTPVDYPLASQDDISKLLAGARGFNFMGTFRHGIVHTSGRMEDRWHQIHFDPALLRKRGIKEDRQKQIRLDANLPKEIVDSPFLQVFQAEAYCILDRTFCEYAINSPVMRRSIALLSHGFISSEQLLPTILGNSNEFGYCPSNFRMNNMAGGPVITMEEIKESTEGDKVKKAVLEMANTGLLFARKFPRVCMNSDDHCANAYSNEPYRNAVFASLVQENKQFLRNAANSTNNQQQYPPLQKVWRVAAQTKLQSLIPVCRQPAAKNALN